VKKPILFSWSGGKDSALALGDIRDKGEYDIISLLTTVTGEYDRISMHGVRRSLLESQAASLGLPLDIISLPAKASDEEYENIMGNAMAKWRGSGVSEVVFGDVHLTEVKEYRERNLRRAGMSGLFPLWGRNPSKLVDGFIADGYRAVVTCVDTTMLDGSFAGRELDGKFLSDLPHGADPCGENGEYHSFVYDGPIFSAPVRFRRGDTVLRDGRFMYADLEPR